MMYIDYSKLWHLLIDRGMTKTDLLELTGISSRVLAKLSKNETVTTDTIARICSALNCNVSEIMECVSEEKLSLYNHYKKNGHCVEKNELYKKVQFVADNKKYTVFISNQAANKATHIHCMGNGSIVWEQFHAIGHIVSSEKQVLIVPKKEKDETVIVLIKGKPGLIKGLDEGKFVSSRGKAKKETDIFVMTETAFKLFCFENTQDKR